MDKNNKDKSKKNESPYYLLIRCIDPRLSTVIYEVLRNFGYKGESPFVLARKGSSRALARNYFGLDLITTNNLISENNSLLAEIELAVKKGVKEIFLKHHGGGCAGYKDKIFLTQQQEEEFQIIDMTLAAINLFIEFPELDKIIGVYYRIEGDEFKEAISIFELKKEYLINIGLIPNLSI